MGVQANYEADYAISLDPGEADDLSELEKSRYYWSGWHRRHWPADVVRPGLKIYGFDKRPDRRELCVLLEVTKGGSFSYASKGELSKNIARLTGWEPNKDHPHWERSATPQRGRVGTGIALRWKVIKRVSLPFPGRFPQLGWCRLTDDPADDDFSDLHEEGRRLLRKHILIERKPRLRARARAYWRKRLKGRLFCLACKFDFENTYGLRGHDFIEMHHNRSLATLASPVKHRASDLVPLCSNCHRMVHRKRDEMLTIEGLRLLLKKHR